MRDVTFYAVVRPDLTYFEPVVSTHIRILD
jgi:hypothetical protein